MPTSAATGTPTALSDADEWALESTEPGEVTAAVDRLLASGDEARLSNARWILVDQTRMSSGAVWRDDHRARLELTNRTNGWAVTPAQLEAQLAQWQLENLTFLFSQLERLGGRTVRSFAFEMADSDSQPSAHRRLALGFLRRTIAPTEAADLGRLEDVSRRVDAPKSTNGSVSNASTVVGNMRSSFMRCYRRYLASTGKSEEFRLRMLIKVGSNGAVTDVSLTGESPASLAACIRTRARMAQFMPPDGGSAVVQVPLTFVVE